VEELGVVLTHGFAFGVVNAALMVSFPQNPLLFLAQELKAELIVRGHEPLVSRHWYYI